jgi:DNA (cytosine-5)-methyltransferase 1
MPEHHISGSESLLLRSPKASEGQGGALGEAEALKRGNTVGVRDQIMDLVSSQGLKVSREADNLFPTPITTDYKNGKSSPGYGLNLPETAKNLMPTPKALDGVKGNLKTSQQRVDSGRQVDLPNVAIDLLGTPRANAANSSSKQVEQGAPKARLEDQVHTNWGKFEPAIRRWEQIIGRTAPEPTKPDGKDGNHRLSSKFTEWMMGLDEGWITDIGLSRNDELKACGNGVVPQQAELALDLLGIKEILKEKTNASL